MSSSAVIADVWLLLDNECDQNARARLQTHIDSCAPCLEHYGIEKQLKSLVSRKCGGDQAPEGLRERLTLLWSNHFVIGTDKVRNMPSVTEYLALLRRHAATPSFAAFALDVARTPAMLRYLDNDQNRNGKPNENFSRELLELFTTGIGHYTEEDVKEGARALSGWTFTGGRGNQKYLEVPKFVFNPKQHDTGRKTYLGKTGNLTGEDVIALAAGGWDTLRNDRIKRLERRLKEVETRLPEAAPPAKAPPAAKGSGGRRKGRPATTRAATAPATAARRWPSACAWRPGRHCSAWR